ncbi:hypothetical protein, partial [Acinetobacter baumannii]|uniref:hypothetical protein n=1 Tax=Acinetobacter baumannii TaxID=470 RepID=UPI001FF27EF8
MLHLPELVYTSSLVQQNSMHVYRYYLKTSGVHLTIVHAIYFSQLDLELSHKLYRKQYEPYRVCRRVNILRDYPDDKTKLYP